MNKQPPISERQQRYVDYCKEHDTEPIGGVLFRDIEMLEIPYDNRTPSSLTAASLIRMIPYHFRKQEGILSRPFVFEFKTDKFCYIKFI